MPSATPTAVLLPGTGSDARFAEQAFAQALRSRGLRVVAIDPDPRRVVRSYVEALDSAARLGPVLAAGVSIGAAIALRWAYDNPDATTGVLAALPAWTGDPATAPAAASARWTASRLRADGLDTVLTEMVRSSPSWLGAALSRSWRAQWPDLPEALDEAAGYQALDDGELGEVVPTVGIVAAVDDAVHPIEVGRQWARALPHAAIETVTLDEVGEDPAVLGTRCLRAFDAATAARHPRSGAEVGGR